MNIPRSLIFGQLANRADTEAVASSSGDPERYSHGETSPENLLRSP